jgi:hypothetical protein
MKENTPIETPPTLRRASAERILERLLPRGVRYDLMDQVIEISTDDFLSQSIQAIAGGYYVQVRQSFDKLVFFAEMAAIIFCFSQPAAWIPLLMALTGILSVLTLRDAYTCRRMGPYEEFRYPEKDGVYLKNGSPAQYVVDAAIDTASVALWLAVTQVVTWRLAPLLGIARPSLFRSAAICLGVLAVVRILLRPRPMLKLSREQLEQSPRAAHRLTRRLNALWIATCWVTVATTPVALPGWLPKDLLVLFTGVTFVVWLRLPQNALSRDQLWRSWMTEDTTRRARQCERLMTRTDQRDALYPLDVALQRLLCGLLLLPPVIALLQWLTGAGAIVDGFRLLANFTVLAVTVASWNTVLQLNTTAARTLQHSLRRDAPQPSCTPEAFHN